MSENKNFLYYHREGTSFTKLEEKKWNERENKERKGNKYIYVGNVMVH